MTTFADLYTKTDISEAIVLANQRDNASDQSQVVPKYELYTLATNLRRSARIPIEELLTPEPWYEDEFEEQVFQDVPWSSDAIPKCNQEVEVIRLEGSEELKAKLCALIL